jgi:drug/metabolite transporter (DMT)-like permease
MFGGCAVTAGATALAGTALGAMAPPPLADPGWWGWALLLGTGFVFANVCLQYGAARLAASATSVIMLSEVLFASTSSVALGAATMEARIWLGGALIVAAAAWSAFARAPTAGDDRRTPSPQDLP